MSEHTSHVEDDPVFAALATEAARRQEYASRCDADHAELMRFWQVLDAAACVVGRTEEELISTWVPRLIAAAQELERFGLMELAADDPAGWQSRRLAAGAIRQAVRGPEAARRALTAICANKEFRNGVRAALQGIADRAVSLVRQRYEAECRRDFPDLAPPAEDDDPPEPNKCEEPRTATGYDPYEREPATFGELVQFAAAWAAFVNPQSATNGRAPIVARDPDHQYLDYYCQAEFGGMGLGALRQLEARYATRTGQTAEQIDATPLREVANFLRRSNGIAPSGGSSGQLGPVLKLGEDTGNIGPKPQPDGPFQPWSFRWKGREREFPKAERRLYRLCEAVWPCFKARTRFHVDDLNKWYDKAGGSSDLSPHTLENYARCLSTQLCRWFEDFPAVLKRDEYYFRWEDRTPARPS